MNKTSIEWCDYTWNPVSGCHHSCRDVYCYNTMKRNSVLNRFGAKHQNEQGSIIATRNWRSRETGKPHIAKKGEIYPFGYDATLYPERLRQPLSIKKPARVFVVDVGDLFGAWVPEEWIKQVLDIASQCPQHTFQFLTKNPKRLLEFEFGKNHWVGTSVNSDKDSERADILKKVPASVKYLSIEPLLGAVTFDLSAFQWLIIGAQTGKNPPLPDNRWVDAILKQAARHNIPIFMKDNLRQGYQGKLLKDFPKSSSPALFGAKKIKAIELLKKGLTSEKVSQITGFSRGQVSAFKAHITMGTY